MVSMLRQALTVNFFAKAIAISAITIGLLIGCNGVNNNNANNNIGNSKSSANRSNNQNLIGTWEIRSPDGSKTGLAVFNANSEVYIISNDLPSGKTAIAGTYKVNFSASPKQIDLTFGDLTTQTIYEIDNNGELKIANAIPEQTRPTSLDSQSQRLIKISDSTTVSNNTKILRSPDLVIASATIRQTEAKSYIRSIMRSQQQIFQDKGRFSNDLSQLMLGFKLNLQIYSYKITIWEGGQVVQNSAVPLRAGLKSYTTVVYAIASSEANQKTTKSIICESNLPTKELPPKTKYQDEDYICPDTYTLID